MEDRLALVLAELIRSLIHGDNVYPEESSIIARAVQLGLNKDELEIIGPLVIKKEQKGQTYCCQEVKGKRVFSKKEQLLFEEEQINSLLYLANNGIISGAELDAILVFAQGFAKNPNEPDYLLKALNLVFQDPARNQFLTGTIYKDQELLN